MTQKIAEITVDLSEHIAETQTKIDEVRRLLGRIECQEAAISYFKKESKDKKIEFPLAVTEPTYGIRTPINISIGTLVPILEQNIEDNAKLIHELAKELGIEVK